MFLKKQIKVWDVDVDNIVISKLLKTKNNYECLIRYLDNVIRPLALILPKMSRYVKFFKGKNNKLMSVRIDDDKLLGKYKTI